MGKKIELLKRGGRAAAGFVPYLGEYLMTREHGNSIKLYAVVSGTVRAIGAVELMNGSLALFAETYAPFTALVELQNLSREYSEFKKNKAAFSYHKRL